MKIYPQSATDTAPALYFYHPDHLGSTAMVTNEDGHITQNVVYIPYGEVFVEERNGSWTSPYLFNAKELDEETGLYYYGARYLNPSIALWLSTDPLQGKYPGMSPYNYCAGNPVKLVDPDGKDMAIKAEDSNALGNARNIYIHLRQISKSKRFTLKITPNGELSYSFTKGKLPWQRRPWGYARNLQKIIDDHSCNVLLMATSYDGSTPPLKDLDNKRCSMYAGAFGGSEVIDGIRTTKQYLCYKQLMELDKESESPKGTSIMHEITESHIGGKIADEMGMSSVKPALEKYKDTPDYQIYKKAHRRALPQPEIMEFNKDGRTIYRLKIETDKGIKYKDLNNF